MELSQSFGLPLQTHLSETLEEVEEIISRTGQRPLQYLDSMGVAGEDLIVAHAVHLDDHEMDLLRLRGIKVVQVLESNMKLTSGVARIPEMLDMGIPVGIGTDGCASNNNLDLFQEMDTAAKMHKVSRMDPVVMGAETVVRMATSEGAKILGLEKEIGTIEVGKRADIIVLDLNSPHLVPLYNPFSTIVYSAGGGDVRDVVVNGRILMKDRIFRTLEPEEIIERVKEISLKINC
jgi:5-methylthioadenosine/S-adenosylhomocysteine deaminase